MQLKRPLLIAAILLIAACSSKKPVEENLSEIQLYQKAQQSLDSNNYSLAIDTLKALDSRYPFGRFADQTQLDLIYANYQMNEPDAARDAADRFIRLHPEHANIDYAYYMRGLTSFNRDRGFLGRFLPLDMTKRDPGAARDSYNEFAQLTSRFPNSRYAPDAKQRMIYLRNLLAAYDIHVAHYYLTRGAYVAAANRGRHVVEDYQETPSVGDGLAVMVEAYRRLGLDDLADTALETLKLNYPDHPNLKNGTFVASTKDPSERSWLARSTLGLIERDAPKPPKQSQATRDVIHQYEMAQKDLSPQLQDMLDEQADKVDGRKRSWFSYLTFGLFD